MRVGQSTVCASGQSVEVEALSLQGKCVAVEEIIVQGKCVAVEEILCLRIHIKLQKADCEEAGQKVFKDRQTRLG